MNRKEWKELCKSKQKEAYFWYNKARNKLLSKEFESDQRTDKDAKVIHHLIDTEEQRKYNDEHYELFGFELDENGNEHFEYGKYVVFWTKEHHLSYHQHSEDTRKKIRESNKISHNTQEYIEKARITSKLLWQNSEYRDKTTNSIRQSRNDEFLKLIGEKISSGFTDDVRHRLSELNKGKHLSEETREKLRQNNARYWKGKQLSEEVKEKISKSLTGRSISEDTKQKISENNAKFFLGKHLSDEAKEKIRKCNLGKKYANEVLEKMRASQLKRYEDSPMSDETKRKISEANKCRKRTDETKQNISKSLKKKFSSGWNPNKGRKHTADTIEKYRLAKLGKKLQDSTKVAIKNRMAVLKEMFILYKTKHSETTWNEFQTLNKGRSIEQIIVATNGALNEQ